MVNYLRGLDDLEDLDCVGLNTNPLDLVSTSKLDKSSECDGIINTVPINVDFLMSIVSSRR